MLPTLVSHVWKQNAFGKVAVTRCTAGTPPLEGCATLGSLLSHTTFCHETWLTLRKETVGSALPALQVDRECRGWGEGIGCQGDLLATVDYELEGFALALPQGRGRQGNDTG